MRLIKMTTCIFAAFCLLYLASGISVSASQSARTVSVFETEGSNLTMTKGTPRENPVRAGMQLSDGHTVTTGIDSFCWFRLGDDTLLKMDQMSKISVNQTSRNRLSISVLSGAALVDALDRTSDTTIETNMGNTAIAIRGTMYIA
jgi:hypothetical protein